MRAFLKFSSANSLESAKLIVYGVSNWDEPCLIIYNASRTAALDKTGWKNGKHCFLPENWNNSGNILSINMQPEITEKLNPAETYFLEIPGSGVCQLEFLHEASLNDDKTKTPQKKGTAGFFVTAAIFLIIWLGGGYLLWQSTLKAPDKKPDENTAIFEMIPKSDEHTSPEQIDK